jgi:hypothetical protein
MSTQPEKCAYCGREDVLLEREHVVPRCIYPNSRATSRIQRLTVPACRECNGAFSVDEPHFRNMLAIVDQPNNVIQELWQTKIRPSFEKCDGRKQANDILEKMEKVLTEDGERQQVRLGDNERVMRIVRKVARGLCHHHAVMSPVMDIQVKAFQVPAGFAPEGILSQMKHDHREADIFKYSYFTLSDKRLHSVWLLTFLENRHFAAYVSRDVNGFA